MLWVSEPLDIEVKQLKTNLENYDCWDFKHYPLTKEESEVVLRLIREASGNESSQNLHENI